MQAVKDALKQHTAIFDSYGQHIPAIKDLADKLEVNAGAPVAAAVFVASVILLLFKGFAIVMTLYTVIYPGVLSIRAIESSNKDDDKHWLTYWMIYGSYHTIDTFIGFIFNFIPYFGLFRIGLFVWLIQFNGAQWVYENVLVKVLQENKELIAQWVKKAKEGAQSLKNQAGAIVRDPKTLTTVITATTQAANIIGETVQEAK